MSAVMETDAIQAEIDIAYQNMMAARTETGERFWCDRMKALIAQRKIIVTPNTPPPRSPGPPGPPQASSAIHSVPTGARGMGSRRSSNVPGKTETTGAESLPAVGAGKSRR